jgi:hypothetical protein
MDVGGAVAHHAPQAVHGVLIRPRIRVFFDGLRSRANAIMGCTRVKKHQEHIGG